MEDLALKLLGEEEGRERYVYPDSEGILSIGIGCVVDKRHPNAAGLCDAAIAAQFQHDSAVAKSDAQWLPGFDKANGVQQAVLVSMCFQLGDLHDWPHFKAALVVGDFNAAADAGLDSKWAREQTPARAQRQMQMLRTGGWVNKQ